MQIQTAVRHHLILIRMTIQKIKILSDGEDEKKWRPLYSGVGGVKWYKHNM